MVWLRAGQGHGHPLGQPPTEFEPFGNRHGRGTDYAPVRYANRARGHGSMSDDTYNYQHPLQNTTDMSTSVYNYQLHSSVSAT